MLKLDQISYFCTTEPSPLSGRSPGDHFYILSSEIAVSLGVGLSWSSIKSGIG